MEKFTGEMERLQKARTGLILGSPFFGSLALRLNLRVDAESKASFWTDGQTVGVHPDAVRSLELDELEGMLARATLNAALGHPFRRGHRDPEAWNLAAAHVAGLEVLSAGMRLPPGSPAETGYKGMVAEQVCALLQPPPAPEGGGEGENASQSGQNDAGEASSSKAGDAAGKPGKGSPSPAQPGVQDGSGDLGQQPSGQGKPEQGKEAAGGSSQAPEAGSGEVRDAPGDAAQVEAKAQEWQEAVAQAAQLARNAGKLPGDLERAALSVIDARVAWQEALFRFFKARAKDDHSWTAASRRYLAHDLYLPGLQSIRMGTVAVAIDLSGSIRQREIDQFLGEMDGIRAECNPERIVLIPFDSRVRAEEVQEIGEFDDLEFKSRGGGGTDFAPVVQYLAERDIEPDVLVYLTDLDCESFAQEPDYPVLWVSTRKMRAPYGEVISLA